MLFAITSATWIVTGLGFGIVLALLICLVFILHGFGWIMQRATAPKEPKPSPVSAPTKENIISAPTKSEKVGDEAAIAYALYLCGKEQRHDAPTAIIAPQARNTAWNDKSIGLNNKGF